MALLRKGSRGSDVTAMQQWLADNGYDVGTVDGIFGPKTLAAVKEAQTALGVSSDGIWGPKTQAAADSFVSTADPAADPDPAATGEVDQGGVTTSTEGNPNEDPGSTGVGGVQPNTISILTSKDMKWFFDQATGEWAVSYKLPNSTRSVVFSASGSQLDAIFGDGQRPTSYEPISFADLTKRENVTFAGNVSEVQGTGTFEGEVDRVIALALDEGVLPKWAQGSGKVYDLLFIAQSEDKSQDWLIDNLAKLPEFQERFPNLNAFTGIGQTTTEAVGSFLEFETGVQQLVIRDGGNPATVTPQAIGDLIGKGHSLTDVTKTYQVFDNMEKNAGALDAFNDVLAFHGQAPMTADDQFAFMAGTAPKEMYDLWEQSSLHQAAGAAGLNLGLQKVLDIANQTAGLTSYESAFEGLTTAAANILRYRTDLDLGAYGLDQEDLIDMSMGIAPASGRSQADIAQGMERAMMAARATRERQRSSPFTGFTSGGKAQQASLGGVRQESA